MRLRPIYLLSLTLATSLVLQPLFVGYAQVNPFAPAGIPPVNQPPGANQPTASPSITTPQNQPPASPGLSPLEAPQGVQSVPTTSSGPQPEEPPLADADPIFAASQQDRAQISVQVLKASLSKTDQVTLSLEEALRMAAADNPTLQAAGDLVNQARAQYQTRLAQMLPDLSLTYGRTHYTGAIQGFGNDIFQVDRKSSNPELVFRFPLFQGGRRFFQMRSAKKTLNAQQDTQQSTLQNTLRQTALNYFQLKRNMDLITIAQQQLEETKAQLVVNQTRMEAGTGVRLDVLQTQTQVARSHQQLLQAVQASQSAAERLNEVLSLSVFASVIPAEVGQQMQTLVPTTAKFADLVTMARNNRPELKALANQIKSQEELRRVAWSAILPEVAVQYRTGGVGTALSNVKNYDEGAYALDFHFTNLAVPALTLYKQNTAQIAELRHRFQAQENAVDREVSEAYLESLTRQSEVAAVRAELAAAEQAFADAIERLQVGVGRNIDVIEAQTSLTRARANLSTTILDYNQAQVNLVYALGLASVETLTQGIQLP
jgi:outer membrane protein TolC